MVSCTSLGLSWVSEPIFEKRCETLSNRSISFCISAIMLLSTSWVSSNWIQAMSDDKGVPSWCAVSFAIPAQTWFCSAFRKDEHTSELQSQFHLVCRLLLEKKKDFLHFRLFHPSACGSQSPEHESPR